LYRTVLGVSSSSATLSALIESARSDD
jgi:hypothetical protein